MNEPLFVLLPYSSVAALAWLLDDQSYVARLVPPREQEQQCMIFTSSRLSPTVLLCVSKATRLPVSAEYELRDSLSAQTGTHCRVEYSKYVESESLLYPSAILMQQGHLPKTYIDVSQFEAK
jgi:hypothetical protein